MADDTTYPKPPQDTVVPGTGSAVQTATDPDGNKWQYDNEKGNWVNLTTGDAVSPKTFSQIAGRSGNTAADTIALSRAMRQEEAALMPPPRPPMPQRPPMPSPQPAALAPPMTQTATQPPAPIASPQSAPLMPPPQRYSPEDMARVQSQRPVPSTRVPPSDAAKTFYKMQQVDWLIKNRGMKPADAMKMVGIGQAPSMKPMHVGDAIINPQTGQPIYTAPPKSMTPFQRESLDERKRQFDAKQAAMEKKIGKLSSTDAKDYTANATRLAAIKRQMDKLQELGTSMTPDQRKAFEGLFNEGMDLLDQQARIKGATGATTAKAPAAVTKPASAKTASTGGDDFVVVTNPAGKRVKIRKAQLDEALASGYKQ